MNLLEKYKYLLKKKEMDCSDNIKKLRVLVDSLEVGKDDGTLNEIGNLITEERKIINELKKPSNKIKHYETICTSILTLIGGTI